MLGMLRWELREDGAEDREENYSHAALLLLLLGCCEPLCFVTDRLRGCCHSFIHPRCDPQMDLWLPRWNDAARGTGTARSRRR